MWCCIDRQQLGGYVATFDLRDPGHYTLQVMLGWYFGRSEPNTAPPPIQLGTHMGSRYTSCSAARNAVGTAVGPIGVLLSIDDASSSAGPVVDPPLQRFGARKCTTLHDAGRWIDLQTSDCRPPHCTGASSRGSYDWVHALHRGRVACTRRCTSKCIWGMSCHR